MKMENILLLVLKFNVIINIFVDRDHEWRSINMRSIGNDAAIVYIIIYILACMRSGWYPHSIIIIIVGISDASNII